MRRATKAMIDFLKIDAQMGLTFAGIAQVTDDFTKRERATRSARKAYDTVVKLRRRFPLPRIDADTLDRNLVRLRGELENLGEAFQDHRRLTEKSPAFSR